MRIQDILYNYLEDLEYWSNKNSIDSVNFYTSGTPQFENHTELREYIQEVENALQDYLNRKG